MSTPDWNDVALPVAERIAGVVYTRNPNAAGLDIVTCALPAIAAALAAAYQQGREAGAEDAKDLFIGIDRSIG